MTPPRLPLTRALLAAIAAGTGRPCGHGVIPRDSQGTPASVPYAILDSLPGLFSGPPFADWQADAVWTYQLTAVGERADQVEWLADRSRTVLVGRSADDWVTPLVAPGLEVIDRELVVDGGGDPVDGNRGNIISYVQRFTITVTPA